uniref:Uncharacterized protein n=1 Tax=Cucumis melo TaxID=3656 RepID=A0A9I9EER5_CUCME
MFKTSQLSEEQVPRACKGDFYSKQEVAKFLSKLKGERVSRHKGLYECALISVQHDQHIARQHGVCTQAMCKAMCVRECKHAWGEAFCCVRVHFLKIVRTRGKNKEKEKSFTFLLQNPSLSFFTYIPLSFFKIPPLTNDERRMTKTPTLTPFFSSPRPFFLATETHGEETHSIACEFLIFKLGNQDQGRFHGYRRKL